MKTQLQGVKGSKLDEFLIENWLEFGEVRYFFVTLTFGKYALQRARNKLQIN